MVYIVFVNGIFLIEKKELILRKRKEDKFVCLQPHKKMLKIAQ